jgi:hypothetical protein
MSRSPSNRSFAPGFSAQLMMSARIRCSTSAARVSPAGLSRIRVVLGAGRNTLLRVAVPTLWLIFEKIKPRPMRGWIGQVRALRNR